MQSPKRPAPRTATGLVLPLAACLASACGAPPSEGGARFAGDVLLDPATRPGPRPLEQALGPNGHHVIYVNFDGVTLGPSYDDSVHNQSSIAAGTGHAVTIPPFNASLYSNQKTRDQVIADVIQLVRTYYAPFNVDVVTQRPPQPNYVMCAVGGLPSLIGYPCQGGGCVGGIAPLDCQVDQNGTIYYNQQDDVEVVYAFSDTAQYDQGAPYSFKLQLLAATIAQESAHSYGLGHENNTRDVMYPVTTGMTTGFRDEASPYADGNNCARGQGTQDSYKLLMQILGANMGGGPDTTPPTIAFTSPANGSTVGQSFSLKMNASDDVGVDHVDVTVSGPNGFSQKSTVSAAPWQVDLMVASDGAYSASATAFDAAGNSASASVSFTVRSGSSGEKDAGTGGPASGDVGAPCAYQNDCKSNICASNGGQQFCTAMCNPGDATSCPIGMYCASVGSDGNFCLFLTSSGTGPRGASGCAIDGRHTSSSGLWLLGLLALPALSRRRRTGS